MQAKLFVQAVEVCVPGQIIGRRGERDQFAVDKVGRDALLVRVIEIAFERRCPGEEVVAVERVEFGGIGRLAAAGFGERGVEDVVGGVVEAFAPVGD